MGIQSSTPQHILSHLGTSQEVQSHGIQSANFDLRQLSSSDVPFSTIFNFRGVSPNYPNTPQTNRVFYLDPPNLHEQIAPSPPENNN